MEKKERKKKPSDYPRFAFRVSKAQKDSLTGLINELESLSNASLGEDDRVVRKNDVIVECLLDGLQRALKAKRRR
jgi:hypothetical protein